MFREKEPPIIISIGGSLIVPNGGIETEFLTQLNNFIRDQVKKGRRFFLVTGGGKIARFYRDAGRDVIGNITDEDLDWLGIHATRLNAHLLRTIFQDIAHPRIIENYERKLINWKEPVVIGAGWKPGWSTDYCAVTLAKDYNAELIINLSNIEWIYDKDPNKYKDAKAIERLTWEEMENLVGTTWTPGINAPFDPVAAQLAKGLGLTVIVTKGTDFENLTKIVEGDVFKGTVIMPFKIDASFYDREYYLGKKGGVRFGYTESLRGKIVYNLANFYRALMIKLFLKPKTVLDVGCGTGYLIKWLRWLGIDTHGVEISQYALDSAKESMKPYLKKADIIDLPYPDNKFDLVLTFDVLEHLERSKIKKAVEETIRVSKKYTLHKVYTTENKWVTHFQGRTSARLSVFPRRYWQNLFSSLKNSNLSQRAFFKLPTFFETVFLLEKI